MVNANLTAAEVQCAMMFAIWSRHHAVAQARNDTAALAELDRDAVAMEKHWKRLGFTIDDMMRHEQSADAQLRLITEHANPEPT